MTFFREDTEKDYKKQNNNSAIYLQRDPAEAPKTEWHSEQSVKCQVEQFRLQFAKKKEKKEKQMKDPGSVSGDESEVTLYYVNQSWGEFRTSLPESLPGRSVVATPSCAGASSCMGYAASQWHFAGLCTRCEPEQ